VSAHKGKDFRGVFDVISKPETITKNAQIISQLGGYKFLETILQVRVPLPDGLPRDFKIGKSKKLKSERV
jgi:hypothetical protein